MQERSSAWVGNPTPLAMKGDHEATSIGCLIQARCKGLSECALAESVVSQAINGPVTFKRSAQC